MDGRHCSDTQTEFLMLVRRERLLPKVEGFWAPFEAMASLNYPTHGKHVEAATSIKLIYTV